MRYILDDAFLLLQSEGRGTRQGLLGFFWWGLLLFLCVFGGSWAEAHIEAPCRQLFQAKEYAKAGRCYELLLPEVDRDPGQKEFALLIKDRFLRNGALAYQRAAQGEKEPSRRAILLEAGVALLKVSYREGYCQASGRCKQNGDLSEQMSAAVGYGKLLIGTQDPKAILEVQGVEYKRTESGTFNDPQIRPGRYEVTIRFAGKPPMKREVEVAAGGQVALEVTPAQIKVREVRISTEKKLPPVIFGTYLAGAILALGGAGLGTYGLLQQADLNAQMNDLQRNQTLSDQAYRDGRGTAQLLTVIGISALGVGVVVILGGVIAHQAAGASVPPKTASRAINSQVLCAGAFSPSAKASRLVQKRAGSVCVLHWAR